MNIFPKLLTALVVATLSVVSSVGYAQEQEGKSRWTLQPDGSIKWIVADSSLPHDDHIEASGEQVSTVLRYGVDEKGAFKLSRSVVWPMLRTIPNNTHASLTRRFDVDLPSRASVDGKPLTGEKVEWISLDGFLRVRSSFDVGDCRVVEVTREIFPSTTKPTEMQLALSPLMKFVVPSIGSTMKNFPFSEYS